MKFILCIAAFSLLVAAAFAGSHGISIGVPLPFIKIRFVDIANLFGHHGHEGGHGGYGGHGGHGGFGGGHGGFGIQIPHIGHGGHGGY